MLTFVEFPASVELLSTGELRMPFSDPVKYCILGISILLLLAALAILIWQIFRCFSETHTSYPHQDTVNSDLLYSEEKPSGAENYASPPSTKQEKRLHECGEAHDGCGVCVLISYMADVFDFYSSSYLDSLLISLQVEDVRSEARRLTRCLSQASFLSESDMREHQTINTVHGSLRFSVYHDQLQASLVVTVLQVEGLVCSRQTSGLQPFVKIRLMWAGSEGTELGSQEGQATPSVLWTVLQEWRTRVVKGSCNPSFGDQFSCILQDKQDVMNRITLRMEVRNFDKFSRHSVLGEVRVPLGKLNISFPLELQEDLQTPQKDLVGEVLLMLKYLPTSQRLEVGLLKVRTAVAESSSNAVMYARISIVCNQSKLRYQKTSAVPRCPVTVFNEVLMFSLPDVPLEQCKILVSVYETQSTGRSNKCLLGQLDVRKDRSSEDEHWTLMVRLVRQPVARWHGLLL